MDACVLGKGGAVGAVEFVFCEGVDFFGQDEGEGVAVFLRREGGEGFLFCGHILRVDVCGEDAVGEEDFCVGGRGGAVDVEHREVV